MNGWVVSDGIPRGEPVVYLIKDGELSIVKQRIEVIYDGKPVVQCFGRQVEGGITKDGILGLFFVDVIEHETKEITEKAKRFQFGIRNM